MQRTVLVLIWLLLSSAVSAAEPPPIPDLAGTWNLIAGYSTINPAFTATVRIAQNGGALSGQFTISGNPCVTSAQFTGKVAIQGNFNSPGTYYAGVDMTLQVSGLSFTGSVSEDRMNGQYRVVGGGCAFGQAGNWLATRVPGPTVTSVANAASSVAGAVAPGEIVMIKGSGLGPSNGVSFSVDPKTGTVVSTLAGTQVFFGGIAAPLTYVSAAQINAIVPYEIEGQSEVVMQVRYQNTSSASIPLVVSSAAPAAFTLNGTGGGQAASVNQNGTLNGPSNPAPRGSYVTIYFTGGGQTSPGGVTGSVTGSVLKWLTQSFSVTVGGQPVTVLFAGAAPVFVDGVGQLNVALGNDAPPGPAQPIVITVGGISSPATASLAVN